MINLKSSHLRINKAPALMGAWGLLILLGSVMQQFFEIRLDYVLVIWGLFTLLGIAAQAVCLVRGLGRNFGIWLALIAIGWFLTLYTIKLDNGYNVEFVVDLPGLWLGLIGLGYVVSAFQVTRKLLILAALSFTFGGVMELEARGIVQIDFIAEYSTLLFGIFAGLPLICASLPYFYRPPASLMPITAPAPAAPAPPNQG